MIRKCEDAAPKRPKHAPITFVHASLLMLLLIITACTPMPPAPPSTSIATAPQKPNVRTATIASGRKATLLLFHSINPDCTSIGDYTIRHTSNPSHGVLVVDYAPVYANYVSANIRSACNKTKVPGTVVSYQSEPSYVGPDHFTFDAIDPEARITSWVYELQVK